MAIDAIEHLGVVAIIIVIVVIMAMRAMQWGGTFLPLARYWSGGWPLIRPQAQLRNEKPALG